MSHTIKRAIIAVVIAAAVYFLSGPFIGYTNYDMYLRATVGILMMIKTEELALPMTEMAMYVKL